MSTAPLEVGHEERPTGPYWAMLIGGTLVLIGFILKFSSGFIDGAEIGAAIVGVSGALIAVFGAVSAANQAFSA